MTITDQTAAPLTAGAAEVLAAAVAHVTDGAATEPREGQAGLSFAAAETMMEAGHHACEAPTGTGKTLGYLAPAAAAAATRGERTLVSTDSLALQAQVIDKDLPAIAAAATATVGAAPAYAVLKGWSNYVCALKAVGAAGELTRTAVAFPTVSDAQGALQRRRARKSATTPEGTLIRWALDQIVDDQPGDRQSYPDPVDDQTWEQVATSTSECLGMKDCPFWDDCRPARARMIAGAADIVVTNHSMLAVQAATGAPVVTGSPRLGPFDHIVVDEAHALPSKVRSQGAVTVSGQRVRATARAVRAALDDKNKTVAELLAEANRVADAVDRDLAPHTRALNAGSDTIRLGEDDDPLEGSGDLAVRWADKATKLLARATGSGVAMIPVLRARDRVTKLRAELNAARFHDRSTARWVELVDVAGEQLPAVKASPVDVGTMLSSRLWTAELPIDDEIAPDRITDDGDRYRLSVIAVSATLPRGFAAQMGLTAAVVKVPSPFTAAFDRSLLYVPRADTDADRAVLARPGAARNGRSQLATSNHPRWAADHVARLVEANNGSALVLAATTNAGRYYADQLRAHDAGGWTVLSQWDGESTSQLVGRWRADEHAVLVGTRSLMTGVDAPGDTCSLVIIDRIPRAASNPVDDARVEHLGDALGLTRWKADELVYVSDAALLLEQAAGRLIRTISDDGMVAVLDPRLLRRSAFTIAEPARQAYLDALGWFQYRCADEDAALEFLRRRSAGH